MISSAGTKPMKMYETRELAADAPEQALLHVREQQDDDDQRADDDREIAAACRSARRQRRGAEAPGVRTNATTLTSAPADDRAAAERPRQPEADGTRSARARRDRSAGGSLAGAKHVAVLWSRRLV